MFKKSLTAIMTLMLAIFVAGCGGGDTPKEATPPTASPDKAIYAYSVLYGKGDTSNIADIGLPEAKAKEISDALTNDIKSQLSAFPLNDTMIQAVTEGYMDHLKEVTMISTTLKKEDKEHPVVEVKATTIDSTLTDESELPPNEGMEALINAMIDAENQGKSLEDLKADEEFQLFAAECLGNFVGSVPLIERTLDVTCEMAKGDDGKLYWAPQNVQELADFVQGR